MKLLNYILIILFFTQLNAYTQETSKKVEQDSVAKVLKKAYLLVQTSKHGEAIKIINEVLSYAKQNDNKQLKARAFNLLGIIKNHTGEKEKAINYFLKSKELYETIKDTSRVIAMYSNIGVAFVEGKEGGESSETYFLKALELAIQSKNNKAAIFPAANLGINFAEQKQYKKSEKYIERALDLLEKVELEDRFRPLIAGLYSSYGLVKYNLGDETKALYYFDLAEEYAKKNELLRDLASVYKKKAEVFEAHSKFSEAHKTLKQYIKINDSILKIANLEQVQKIEAEYFVKENESKLKLIEKEKQLQKITISESNTHKIMLVLFSLVLLLGIVWVFKKNKQLKLAKENAERLSRAKSDFYSEISHELRTPLYAVIELSTLLLKEDIDVKHKEYIETLKFSGDHLMSLINNVLQLNKAESGKMKVQLLDFELKYMVSNIIHSLEYALQDSKNVIHLNYDNTIPKLLVGDSLKLSQVFINLISNAIKFTNNGEIHVSINKLEEHGENVKIRCEVSDNGLGITKEKQIKIFEEFYQEHTKSENIYNGTGLGLSIVKRVLNAMGSEIEIESEINKGTSFFFEVTFEKSNVSNTQTALYADHLEGIKGSKILIVDDNKVNQLVTRKVLESLEINSESVDSGKKAIEAIKRTHYDCVLMDLHMPELNGYDTTKIIRKFNKHIPIIALTAATTDEVELEIKNHEIDGYVLKPFITAEFVQILNKAIKNNEEQCY